MYVLCLGSPTVPIPNRTSIRSDARDWCTTLQDRRPHHLRSNNGAQSQNLSGKNHTIVIVGNDSDVTWCVTENTLPDRLAAGMIDIRKNAKCGIVDTCRQSRINSTLSLPLCQTVAYSAKIKLALIKVCDRYSVMKNALSLLTFAIYYFWHIVTRVSIFHSCRYDCMLRFLLGLIPLRAYITSYCIDAFYSRLSTETAMPLSYNPLGNLSRCRLSLLARK